MGRWVIIATERARRPGNFVDRKRNIFTESKDSGFIDNRSVDIYTVKEAAGGGWKVRVVPSGTPLLTTHKQLVHRGHGMYDVLSGYGVHEIVIDTPDPIMNMADLDADQIRLVLETWVTRFNALKEDPHLLYAFAFKNYGDPAQESMGHAYSQIVASPVIPLHIEEKLTEAQHYYDYHERCLYADIVKQETAERRRVITESDHFLALIPFASRFVFEVWIVPKKMHYDFCEGVKGLEKDLARILRDILQRFKIGLGDPPYTFVVNSSPFQRRQSYLTKWKDLSEAYCWHIELTPRLTRVAGFEKGTGFYICSIPPEDMAEYLRNAK